MATRYAGNFEFDHGVQFFTARTRAFRAFLEPMRERGVIAPWHACFAELSGIEPVATRRWGDTYPHYVGVPRMNAVCKWLAKDLDVRTETAITALTREDGHWRLSTDRPGIEHRCDWVVCTAPGAQTASLLPAESPLGNLCAGYTMQACFALLLGFARQQALPWQATRVRDADISWMSVNHSKPGRPIGYSLLVHSTNSWADDHLDDDPETIRAHLLREVAELTGIRAEDAAYKELHCWRHANISRQQGERFAIDPRNGLAAAGDWFVRGRVEGAYLSASALASRLRSVV
jgi:predicted NAD/FAD-dependent oxidoreductase